MYICIYYCTYNYNNMHVRVQMNVYCKHQIINHINDSTVTPEDRPINIGFLSGDMGNSVFENQPSLNRCNWIYKYQDLAIPHHHFLLTVDTVQVTP